MIYKMDAKKVVVLVKWRIKEGHLDDILQLIPELGEKSSSEPGNLAYEVYQDNEDLQSIYLYESYKDSEAAEAHKQSEHYQRIVAGKVIPLLEKREVMRVKTIFKK